MCPQDHFLLVLFTSHIFAFSRNCKYVPFHFFFTELYHLLLIIILNFNYCVILLAWWDLNLPSLLPVLHLVIILNHFIWYYDEQTCICKFKNIYLLLRFTSCGKIPWNWLTLIKDMNTPVAQLFFKKVLTDLCCLQQDVLQNFCDGQPAP